MIEEILECWRVNHRINMMLIDGISEDGLRSSLSVRGGRDVAMQFAHLHHVRISWMEAHSQDLKKAASSLRKFENKYSPAKNELKEAHKSSADAMEKLFELGVTENKVRGFKRSVITMLGYFLAHDAHHRGNILLTLKQTGHQVSEEIRYAIWEWGKI